MPCLERRPAHAHGAVRRRLLARQDVEEVVLPLAVEGRDPEHLAGPEYERDLVHLARLEPLDLEDGLGCLHPRRRVRHFGGVALDRLDRRPRGLGPQHVLDDPLLPALLGHDRRDRAAVAEDRRAVARRDHLFQPVRDEEHRPAALAGVAHDGEYALGQIRRQRSRDLVEQQETRLPREGAREVDHAQERQRNVARLLGKVDIQVESVKLAPHTRRVAPGQPHVLRDGQVGHERRVLEHRREPDSRRRRRRVHPRRPPVDRDRAGAGRDHARQQLDERRLACPVRAEERVYFPRLDHEVGRPQRDDGAVALCQAERFENWRAFGHGETWRRAVALLHRSCCRAKPTAPCS